MNSFNTGTEDVYDVNISSWILHNLEDATTELGEDMISSILEEMYYE